MGRRRLILYTAAIIVAVSLLSSITVFSLSATPASDALWAWSQSYMGYEYSVRTVPAEASGVRVIDWTGEAIDARHVDVLRDGAAVELASKTGIAGRVDYVHIIAAGGKRYAVFFAASAEGADRLVAVVDLESGRPVDAELVKVRELVVPVGSRQFDDGVLEQSLRAVAYELVIWDGPLRISAGYYIEPEYRSRWYLGSVLIYEVVAKGRFYVVPGTAVYLVSDKSYSSTYVPFVTKCSFSSRTMGVPSIEMSVRADGVAALTNCPVTTKYEAWALVSVNIYGSVDYDGGGDKWITPGCGCYAP